jgi:hypothetical protein
MIFGHSNYMDDSELIFCSTQTCCMENPKAGGSGRKAGEACGCVCELPHSSHFSRA